MNGKMLKDKVLKDTKGFLAYFLYIHFKIVYSSSDIQSLKKNISKIQMNNKLKYTSTYIKKTIENWNKLRIEKDASLFKRVYDFNNTYNKLLLKFISFFVYNYEDNFYVLDLTKNQKDFDKIIVELNKKSFSILFEDSFFKIIENCTFYDISLKEYIYGTVNNIEELPKIIYDNTISPLYRYFIFNLFNTDESKNELLNKYSENVIYYNKIKKYIYTSEIVKTLNQDIEYINEVINKENIKKILNNL